MDTSYGIYHRDRRRSIIHDWVHESVSDARQPILLFIVALNGNGRGLGGEMNRRQLRSYRYMIAKKNLYN